MPPIHDMVEWTTEWVQSHLKLSLNSVSYLHVPGFNNWLNHERTNLCNLQIHRSIQTAFRVLEYIFMLTMRKKEETKDQPTLSCAPECKLYNMRYSNFLDLRLLCGLWILYFPRTSCIHPKESKGAKGTLQSFFLITKKYISDGQRDGRIIPYRCLTSEIDSSFLSLPPQHLSTLSTSTSKNTLWFHMLRLWLPWIDPTRRVLPCVKIQRHLECFRKRMSIYSKD